MSFDELIRRLKDLRFEETRKESEDYLEFVIESAALDAVSRVLESHFGPAFKPAGRKPSAEAVRRAAPHGGVRPDQILYYAEEEGVSTCALIWPWGDGRCVTVKLAQGATPPEPKKKPFGIFRSAAVALFLFQTASASAAVVEQRLEYRHGDVVLEGFLAYDDSLEGSRPGVLVVHEWKGPGAYTERRARQLAEAGYVAFAADMYGKGVRPATHEEAAKISGIYKSDRSLMRARAQAGLDVLKAHPLVDAGKIAAIGYCFGGTTALELARSGNPDIDAVVSFHGALAAAEPAAPGAVKAKVLALHGADDPFIKPEEVEAFKREMEGAGADMRFVAYPGAVHSFTVEEAGNDMSKGSAYNADADQASWNAMIELFESLWP